jgi:death on curing protein
MESAIFRPQCGSYRDIFEEATALLESLAENQAFLDGNKRVSFLLTDIMLRANGLFLDVDPIAAHAFITGLPTLKDDRFAPVVEWIKSAAKPP